MPFKMLSQIGSDRRLSFFDRLDPLHQAPPAWIPVAGWFAKDLVQ